MICPEFTPRETCVIVFVPPVASGNWISAALLDVFPATVHPAEVLMTFTRAYEV